MCGIIGINSNKEVSSPILSSLRKLEYRGYDSAGIATLNNGYIQEVKCEGRVDNLEKNIVKILENENVAYDIGSYRSAPPGLRIWGGPTINPKDIKLLLPWLQWAFEDAYKSVIKGK